MSRPANKTTRCGRREPYGFTLIEMMVAVMIVGVLAAVVVPSLGTSDTRVLEAAARVLASDLRLARSYAIRHNTSYSIQFDPVSNAYDLLHSGSGNPPPIENPFAPAGTALGIYHVNCAQLGGTGNLKRSVRLWVAYNKSTRWQTNAVTFGPLGGTGPATSDNTVIFLGEGFGRGTRFIVITVSWITGQVWIGPPQLVTAGNILAAFQ